MSRQYGLAVSNRPADCSCPCSVAHNGTCAVRVVCEVTIPAGRQYGVLVLDGEVVAKRCQPCAFAAGWITR